MTLYEKLLLFIGLGVNVQTLSANLTLTGNSEHFQLLTPSGANRNVTLDAPGTTAGVPSLQGNWHLIRCDSAASYSAVIKNGATTLVTLAPGDWAYVACGGSLGAATWKVMASSAGLATLTLTGALSAASATITGALSAAATTHSGRLTTTDGVTSGNARIVGGNVHTKQSATTLTNSTTDTVLGTHTLPANTLKAGTTLRVRALVRVTGHTLTPTFTMAIKIGATPTVLATTGAVSVVTNDLLRIDVLLTARDAPSGSSVCVAEGIANWTASGTAGSKPQGSVPSLITNGALDVAVYGQWSAASASNIAVCESFVADVVA